MKLLRKMMSTGMPGTIILPRLFVAAVLIVDSLRGWPVSQHLGRSAIDNLQISNTMAERALCVLQLICAAAIATGLLTRLAAVLVIAQWTLEITTAWSRVGSLGTATALDETLVAAGVVSVCLLLLFRGAGIWSIDASLVQQRAATR